MWQDTELGLDKLPEELDWCVHKEPLYYLEGRTVPDKVAIVRSDNYAYLGTVSSRYEIIQNKEAFDFMKTICEGLDGRLVYTESVGDKKVLFVVRFHGRVNIATGDDIQKYLVVMASHDGTNSLKVFLTNKRIVCSNMVTAAFKEGNGINIRHSKNAESKMKEAECVIKKVIEEYDVLAERYRNLVYKPIEVSILESVFECIFNPSNPEGDVWKDKLTTLTQMVEYEATGRGYDYTLGSGEYSAWAVYNAITAYCTHVVDRKNNMLSMLAGTDATICKKTLEILEKI